MSSAVFLRVPVGRGAQAWRTAQIERRVLVVVHTVTSGGHLLDAVELLEPDDRVQVVYTQAPDVFGNGVVEFLQHLGVVVVPWEQAKYTRFDLVLAADSAGLHELDGPVLLMAHGVVGNKLSPEVLSGPNSSLVVGLGAPWLLWYGRLIPAAIALSHQDQCAVLAQQCPTALDVAAVIGDLCWDRLRASMPERERYRRALGVEDDRAVVAVTSTWGAQSLFGRWRELVFGVLGQVSPRGCVVVLTLHPAVWFGHGPRQVSAWLAEHRRWGLRVVRPGMGWRGLLSAADVLVGDHGSVTSYGAGLGLPVLRVPGAGDQAPPGSALAVVAGAAPELRGDRAFADQAERAALALSPAVRREMAGRISSRPGRAAELLGSTMYRLLKLAEPGTAPVTNPVAVPELIENCRGR